MTLTAKRGRPAKVSREMIVHTAIDLLVRDSETPFSIHRLAKALGVTPMAIYRHVENKNALMQEIAIELLQCYDPQIPVAADWSDQLRIWASQTREHFLGHPAFFSILGWQEHIASGWLQQIALLTRIIARSGLEGIALADAVQWTANSVMAGIHFELHSRQSGYRVSQEDIKSLSAEDCELIHQIMNHLINKSSHEVFDDSVERIVNSINLTNQMKGL